MYWWWWWFVIPCFLQSYRYFPVNLDVISWLGVWYVKAELYERAIEFFERASDIQPDEVKWKLMVTSCYRRMGNFQMLQNQMKQVEQKIKEKERIDAQLAVKDLGAAEMKTYNDTMEQETSYSEMEDLGSQIAALEEMLKEYMGE